MIVGLFLRHYKVYRAINFIPVSTGAGFSAYLGGNGCGKSSILDALDKFFNGGDWSINAQAKSDGGISGEDKSPFIMPVFLIKKGELDIGEPAETLSSYLWETKFKTVEAFGEFYKLRDQLLSNGYSADSHYLIAIGKQYNKPGAYLGSFAKDSQLQAMLALSDFDDSATDNLLTQIINRYAYFYIPVEADSNVFSALESKHVQKLLDEDIREKIQRAIGNPTVGVINSSLNEFITEINASLKHYEYKGAFKNRLTMNDLVDKVFDAYFSIKLLHGKRSGHSIPIRDMSAGEKRRALLDLAYSLLARSADRNHTVILAVDEPDASLHASACHEQFSKLADIPQLTNPKSQVLVTTHWYGFLPIVQNGIAHAITPIDEKINFFSFDLYNFREQIKHLTKDGGASVALDVELKSYNDMLQSIVSSVVRSEPYNWILCEGLSDKIYLDYYLSDLVKDVNLRILPLGGFKEVRRAYDYLWQPLNDPNYRMTGKVLCLVDTDSKMENVELKPNSKALEFNRIIFDDSLDSVVMLKVDDQKRSPSTEIEQALNADQFLMVVDKLRDGIDTDIIRSIIEEAKMNEASESVFGRLDLRPSESKKMMDEYFDINNNKVAFAKKYVELTMADPPVWITEIRSYFKPVPRRTRKMPKTD